MKLFRCSSLHKLIGDGRSKAAVISDTAKSAIRDIVKEDLYGFRSFTGNQYTQKGNMLEDLAIEMSGKMRYRNYKKHVGRVENKLITGECDVLDLEQIKGGAFEKDYVLAEYDLTDAQRQAVEVLP